MICYCCCLVVGLAASSNDLSLVCCKCWHRQPTLVWGRSCFQIAPRTAWVIRSQTTTKESQLSGTLAVFVGNHVDIRRISLAWARCVVLVCAADIARALAFKALALILPPPAQQKSQNKQNPIIFKPHSFKPPHQKLEKYNSTRRMVCGS